MTTNRRGWRWRRNPLKRGTDRAEAWALLATGLLLVLGAPAVGVATGLEVMAPAPGPPADWHHATAVLTHKAPPAVITGVGAGSQQVRATVQWQGSPGHPRTGQALVRPDSPAGSRT